MFEFPYTNLPGRVTRPIIAVVIEEPVADACLTASWTPDPTGLCFRNAKHRQLGFNFLPR